MRLTLPLYLLFLAIAASVYPRWAASVGAIWFGNIAQILALVIAGVNLTLTGDVFGRKDAPRKAWMRLSIGMWIWVIAQCMETYCELVLKQVSYGTITDSFWVIGYFPLLGGVFLLVKNYNSTGLPMGSVRSYVVQGALLLLLYGVVFHETIWDLLKDPERPLVFKLLDVGYPTFDWILIAMGSILARVAWQMRGGSLARSWILLCVGFALTYVADLLLSYATDFNTLAYRFLDVIYFSAYFMVALSAKTQHDIVTKN